MKPAVPVSWQHVTIILGFFATLYGLAKAGQETASFVVVGVALLGGLGLMVHQNATTKSTTEAVKDQTNGNTSLMLGIIQAQGQMLAAMQPVTPPGAVSAAYVDLRPFERGSAEESAGQPKQAEDGGADDAVAENVAA